MSVPRIVLFFLVLVFQTSASEAPSNQSQAVGLTVAPPPAGASPNTPSDTEPAFPVVSAKQNTFQGTTDISIGFIYVSIEAGLSVFALGHISNHVYSRPASFMNRILLLGVVLVLLNSFDVIGLALRNGSDFQCLTAGMLCGVYWFLQILTYVFLVEKQRLVRFPPVPRKHDKQYIFNMVLVLGYLIVTFLYLGAFEFTFRIVGEECQFGNGSTLNYLPVLLTADTILSAWWTLSFVYPLWKMSQGRAGKANAKEQSFRQAVKRNALACLICTCSTAINLGILYNVPGYYPYYCNAGCNLDMLINLGACTWVSAKFDAAKRGPNAGALCYTPSGGPSATLHNAAGSSTTSGRLLTTGTSRTKQQQQQQQQQPTPAAVAAATKQDLKNLRDQPRALAIAREIGAETIEGNSDSEDVDYDRAIIFHIKHINHMI